MLKTDPLVIETRDRPGMLPLWEWSVLQRVECGCWERDPVDQSAEGDRAGCRVATFIHWDKDVRHVARVFYRVPVGAREGVKGVIELVHLEVREEALPC